MREAAAGARALAAEVTGIVAVVGAPDAAADDTGDAPLRNAALVLAEGRIAAAYHKHHLPNYAVFDERRYFAPGRRALVLEVHGWRIGLTICEDIWMPGGPADWSAAGGRADLIANLSASPYHRGKGGGAGAPVRRALPPEPLQPGVLQRGRRPGRAGVRRAQSRHRPGRRG